MRSSETKSPREETIIIVMYLENNILPQTNHQNVDLTWPPWGFPVELSNQGRTGGGLAGREQNTGGMTHTNIVSYYSFVSACCLVLCLLFVDQQYFCCHSATSIVWTKKPRLSTFTFILTENLTLSIFIITYIYWSYSISSFFLLSIFLMQGMG